MIRKRAKCSSDLCRIRSELAKYLDFLLDTSEYGWVDKERNSNETILRLIFGEFVKVYRNGKEELESYQGSKMIKTELFDLLLTICENE